MWPYGIIVYLALFFVFFILLIATAPLGVEDKNGFHYLARKSK
jgi:hypothetical protein